MSNDTNDNTRVWAFGIVEPGWYCARAIWVPEYAKHLESLGYRVVRSANKPDFKAAGDAA